MGPAMAAALIAGVGTAALLTPASTPPSSVHLGPDPASASSSRSTSRYHPHARRTLLAAASAAVLTSAGSPLPATAREESWGPLAALSTSELDALDERSRAEPGTLLPSGVRVIDLVVGEGPAPAPGTRVYCHYKVWAKGFRVGQVADFTFADGRPYSWVLGKPTDRIPREVDEGTVGMREGGWRRIFAPTGYGTVGLKRINRWPNGERFTGSKASYAIKPNAEAYFDLIMLDGGSGRCDALLRPAGVSEEDALGIKSLTCTRIQ